MTVDQKPTISVDDIRSALPHALELVDARWLSKQRKRRSVSTSLLEPKAALFTRAENLHAVRSDAGAFGSTSAILLYPM